MILFDKISVPVRWRELLNFLPVNYDPTTAKEMLLMAATLEDQQLWVTRLLKKIQKSGFKG